MADSYANIPVPTPTQNSVPSADIRDHVFGGAKIDEFVTSMGWTYTDRVGVKHYTIEGINYLAQQVMNAFGYIILPGVTFTTGANVNTPNEVLFNTPDNSYYKWSGSFGTGPKVVPPNSTPESSGGVGPGKWLNVGDSTLRGDLATGGKASLVGYGDGTVEDELVRSANRRGDVVYAADYLPDTYTPGADVSAQMLDVVAAVNGIPNTEHNGKPITLEFPSGVFKHSSTMWFKRPVVLTSTGDTKLEFIGTGNQIKFGPDGITFNGEGGGLDHRLHVTYGFIGKGIFTFTGDLLSDGIVYNEYVTNPRIIGLRFINYGSEDYYQVKLWGQCWDITVDNIRHTNTQSKAVNFLSANGKMKDGTIDYGNSRLHVGSDVYMHIEGSSAGGVCFDVGGADYRFNGVAQGWRVTHQLGSFASNPRINGYHETIFVGCESVITYGGTPLDAVLRDDGYFDGGVIGGDGFYWNAHNLTGTDVSPPTNCIFMKPGRTDVSLKNCKLDKVDLADFDNSKPLVYTNIIQDKPSYGNSYSYVNYPAIQIHQQNAQVQTWTKSGENINLVVNGGARLSRSGDSFTFNTTASYARVFDFWEYNSSGTAVCNIYRSQLTIGTQFSHDGTSANIVVPTANNDTKSVGLIIDKDALKYQGKQLTLSFMAVNGTPSVATKVQATLQLVFSSSAGYTKNYSFGLFDIGSSWGLKGFTIDVPFEDYAYSADASAHILFDLPTGQTSNIYITNVNLFVGNVKVQGPSMLKDWDVLSQSKSYYGA